jgi:hypothetical protein
MALLVRRISRAKWDNIKNNDVCADAITNCLKTNNNDLSVWKIKSEKELNEAILALVTGSRQTQLSTLHYVLIDENLVLSNGLSLRNSPGDTVVSDLVNNHCDIEDLTYKKLGQIKDLIINSIQTNKVSFITKSKLKTVLVEAIKKGKLDKQSLNPELIQNEKL